MPLVLLVAVTVEAALNVYIEFLLACSKSTTYEGMKVKFSENIFVVRVTPTIRKWVVKRAYQPHLRNSFVSENKTYKACWGGGVELTKRQYFHHNTTASTHITTSTTTIIITATTTTATKAKTTTINSTPTVTTITTGATTTTTNKPKGIKAEVLCNIVTVLK